jgi:hypothetical protein
MTVLKNVDKAFRGGGETLYRQCAHNDDGGRPEVRSAAVGRCGGSQAE